MVSKMQCKVESVQEKEELQGAPETELKPTSELKPDTNFHRKEVSRRICQCPGNRRVCF